MTKDIQKIVRKNERKNFFRNSVIAGTLCAVLVVPVISVADNAQPAPGDDKIIPISYELNHWSENYIEQLSNEYNAGYLFEGKDLEAFIELKDFRDLVKLVLDKDYEGEPDSLSREAVTHELVKIWAEKTGKDLEDIAVIALAIYEDTHEIDPKYNHSITLAYMNKIAIGKGSGIFDPKANVRYGELAALVLNTDRAIKNDLDSGKENISEGRFETRGSYEIKDDKVIFDFELVNHHEETKQLKFGSGQQFEITVTDEKGEEVYRYSDGKFFTMALLFKDIGPGESVRWQDEWDMTNKEGEKIAPGKYKAEIKILALFEEGDEKIEEDQLTTELELVIE